MYRCSGLERELHQSGAGLDFIAIWVYVSEWWYWYCRFKDVPSNSYNMIFYLEVLYCKLQTGHSTKALLVEGQYFEVYRECGFIKYDPKLQMAVIRILIYIIASRLIAENLDISETCGPLFERSTVKSVGLERRAEKTGPSQRRHVDLRRSSSI